MTAQEIFDTVVTRLRAQGAQAWDLGVCKYRAPDGRKCAVGHLIPDCIYDRRMEDMFVGSVLDQFPAVRPYLLATDLSEERGEALVKALQFAHDWGDNINRPDSDETWLAWFLQSARETAKVFGLDPRSTTEEAEYHRAHLEARAMQTGGRA